MQLFSKNLFAYAAEVLLYMMTDDFRKLMITHLFDFDSVLEGGRFPYDTYATQHKPTTHSRHLTPQMSRGRLGHIYPATLNSSGCSTD